MAKTKVSSAYLMESRRAHRVDQLLGRNIAGEQAICA
jgi:hypothetical protein